MTDAQQLDPIMVRIGEAIELGRAGERAAAIERFDTLWGEADASGDPLYRVVVAHYGADVQAEVADSLVWNRRALEAANEATDDVVQRHHPELRVAAFFPSLHLNLARDYFTLGDEARSREHLEAANERVDALPEDGYGSLVRAGLARMAADLAGEPPPVQPHSGCFQHAHSDHPHN